jgi:hypothetical protein
MTQTLQHLLEEESVSYSRLDALLRNEQSGDDAIDKLSSHYEGCLNKVLAYRAKTSAEATEKCRFIFDFIRRDYEDTSGLDKMKNSLLEDLNNFG